MWDLIVSVPDHCLSFYFTEETYEKKNKKRKLIFGTSYISLL